MGDNGKTEDGKKETGLELVGESAPETPVDALKREVTELKDSLLRRSADLENFRKRAERERQLAASDAAADVFKELIPILDNFYRALTARGSDEALRAGVEMIARQMRAFLESRGIVVDDPLGQPFDPKRHEVLTHEAAAGHKDGVVLEVFQKGYSLKDRLLRPALVKVVKNEPPQATDGDDSAALSGRMRGTPWDE
jgi:molecular chaperone GrpE